MKRFAHPSVLVVVGLVLLALYGIRHTVSSTTLLVFAVAVPSIILHEVSHGVAALAFGDDTARRAGRITLNPIRHVDPMGTLVLPALLALSGLGAFGYAKPVPIDPGRMRHPRNHAVVVSLAGPATNLVLAALSVVVLRAVLPADNGPLTLGDRLLYWLGFVNVTLAVFNALPIPPLDGSAVVGRLLPRSAMPAWYNVQRYGMAVLLVVVLLNPGHFLDHVFGPAQREWARLVAG